MLSLIKVFSVFCIINNVYGGAIINKIEMCDPKKDYPLKYTASLKTEDGKQSVEEAVYTASFDMDENVQATVGVFLKGEGEQWTKLMSETGDVCDLQDKYGGVLIREMEKAAGQNGCPIPKGTYTLKNYPLDFTKFGYKDFPDGTIKLHAEINDKKTKNELGCIELEFTLKH